VPVDKYCKHGSNLIDSLYVKLGLRNFVYSVVIDAGSTASRIHAYRFIEGPDSLKLYDEVFVQLSPGLSAFAAKPAEVSICGSVRLSCCCCCC